jgi:hypothetical protein
MNEILTQARKVRRESLKGLSRITIADSLDKELVEDIVAVAPSVQMLCIDVLEDTSIDIALLKALKDLISLKIRGGRNLQNIKLEGIQELGLLLRIEININPERSIEEIDLAHLANHHELKVVTIACPTKNLKSLDAFRTIPNLESIGFYSLDVPELNLSALTGCKKLESIYLGDLGQQNPTKPYRLILPRNVPLKVLEISECYSEDLELEIDFAFVQDIESIDSLVLKNCNLTSFDFGVVSSLKRIGKIDLSENKITHLDVTPILEIPTYTETALGEPPFVIDSEVIIQIEKKRERDIPKIVAQPDAIIEDHEGHYAIAYEFGYQWLKKLLDTHTIDWI